MVSASLLVQARRSSGLSQRALADRAGVAQQEIARYERGRVTPSLERLRALIAACGLELTFGLARADDSYDAQITDALTLAPALRLERAVDDAAAIRASRPRTADTHTHTDVLGVLRALSSTAVRFVLVGELAEVLHGSPLLPINGMITIVPRAGQRDTLRVAIAAGGGRPEPIKTRSSSIDPPARFTFESAGGIVLVVEPAPIATHGYDDLQRDATPMPIAEELVVAVASLVDLVRIAEASADHGRLPALRRTLELTPTAAPRVDAA